MSNAHVQMICGQCKFFGGVEYMTIQNPETDWMEGWRIICKCSTDGRLAKGWHYVVPGVPPSQCPFRVEWIVV